jgi:hypothetical protein
MAWARRAPGRGHRHPLRGIEFPSLRHRWGQIAQGQSWLRRAERAGGLGSIQSQLSPPVHLRERNMAYAEVYA